MNVPYSDFGHRSRFVSDGVRSAKGMTVRRATKLHLHNRVPNVTAVQPSGNARGTLSTDVRDLRTSDHPQQVYAAAQDGR